MNSKNHIAGKEADHFEINLDKLAQNGGKFATAKNRGIANVLRIFADCIDSSPEYEWDKRKLKIIIDYDPDYKNAAVRFFGIDDFDEISAKKSTIS